MRAIATEGERVDCPGVSLELDTRPNGGHPVEEKQRPVSRPHRGQHSVRAHGHGSGGRDRIELPCSFELALIERSQPGAAVAFEEGHFSSVRAECRDRRKVLRKPCRWLTRGNIDRAPLVLAIAPPVKDLSVRAEPQHHHRMDDGKTGALHLFNVRLR